jgi:acetolactate synthase-1/3 small subunit/acetolactate synthase II small subunit
MSGRIAIDFALVQGAVLRVLGVVERRGFELRGIAMAGEGAVGSLVLDVEATDAGRRLEIVAGHLSRLHEVHKVTFTPAASALP